MDFDKWLAGQTIVDPAYVVGYLKDGSVVGIYPADNPPTDYDTVSIDRDQAEAVLDGKDNLLSFRVDIPTKKLVKINKFQTWGVEKIDDVLHRIVDKKWSNIEDHDVCVSYDRINETLMFEMNSKYNGINWEGETEMIFLLTEYNDPNLLRSMISIRVGDISGDSVSKKIKLPNRFSIYTRRVFQHYIFQEI